MEVGHRGRHGGVSTTRLWDGGRKNKEDQVVGEGSFRLGGGACRMRHSGEFRLPGSIDPRPTESSALGRGIKNSSYIK